MFRSLTAVFALTTLFAATPADAQYNVNAGVSAQKSAKRTVTKEVDGEVVFDVVEERVHRDEFGNAGGSAHDLAVDGAFGGQTIVVVQLYPFSFEQPRRALEKKGFSVYRFNGAPEPDKLQEALTKANQFWLISHCTPNTSLNEDHAKVIKNFFDKGHGVYIWGDNDPCYADANFISNYLFDVEMKGDLHGDQVITFRTKRNKSGIVRDHLLSTGIENMYEGITIATIQENEVLTPLIWGSAGNLVASYYDQKGKRAIVDGGFTRLYYKWNTAGTARYVTNAAAWLANVERFGDKVVAKEFRSDDTKAN